MYMRYWTYKTKDNKYVTYSDDDIVREYFAEYKNKMASLGYDPKDLLIWDCIDDWVWKHNAWTDTDYDTIDII